jgi:hypothetical protein
MATPGSWRVTAAALRRIVLALQGEGLTVGPLRDHIAA